MGTQADLDLALWCSDAAAELALTYFDVGVEASTKADGTPVTEADRAVGLPCNQFMGQEPGSPEEIAQFCSATYGVTFPLTEKIEVNGDGRHPLYRVLVEVPDSDGYTGDIGWNCEKLLIAPGGKVVTRFAPTVEPEAEPVVDAIESNLPG